MKTNLIIQGILVLMILVLFPFNAYCKPEVPANIQIEEVTDGGKRVASLTWDVSTGAKGYDIFREKTDVKDDFGRIGKSSTNSFQDHRVLPGRKYMYYVVAYTDNSISDKSEIVKIQIGASGSTSNTKIYSNNNSKSGNDFLFNIVVSGSYNVAYNYNFKTGVLQYTNTTTGSWQPWNRLATLDLPAEYNSTSILNFTADPVRIFAWVWNPDSQKAFFSTCNLNSGTFNPWTEFPVLLTTPPNWGPNTRLLCDTTEKLTIFASYNTDDGTMFVSRAEGQLWTSWAQYGTITKPQNHSDTAFYSVGIRIVKEKADWGLFCYNFEKNTIYQSIRTHENFSWLSWTPAPQIFSIPANLSN